MILWDLHGSKSCPETALFRRPPGKKKQKPAEDPVGIHFATLTTHTFGLSYLQITSTYMTNPNDIINRHKPSPQSSQFPLQNPHMDMPQVLPAPPAASCLNDNSDTYQRCRSNEPLSSIHYGNTKWSCVICLMIFIPIV